MFSTTDTIVAIATPPGRGGIGVIRVSGPQALAVTGRLITRQRPLVPRHATFTTVRRSGDVALITANGSSPCTSPDSIDQVVAVYFAAPASYTGEDVVELSAHGSPVVLHGIVKAAMEAGARLAEPGEFTLRAFLNGRIDLPQAEAVRDLIEAVTPVQARAAFDQLQGTLTGVIGELDAALFDLVARLEASVDFPEEGYHFLDPDALVGALKRLVARADALLETGRRGRLVREGLQIAILGKPNVGKSSLFNALVGTGRAIVSEVPGTTRDLVSEVVEIEGLRVTLVDTAGLRDTLDGVESEGVDRARQAQAVADVVLVVMDGSRPLDANDQKIMDETAGCRRLLVLNKSDVGIAVENANGAAFVVSAVSLDGIPGLREGIADLFGIHPNTDRPEITNLRHLKLVEKARDAMTRAVEAVTESDGRISEEFVLADLQDARGALEEVSGRRTPEHLLEHIFSQFCIGK
jgi:tRNA modification GTPase